jgi:hypothetical protein
MKRVLVGSAGIALATGLLFLAANRFYVSMGPVYTVAQVQIGIGRQPRSWAGRTVLVRALATPLGANCPASVPWCTNVVLSDRDPGPAATPTLVAMAAQPDPFWSLLRRVPLMDRVIADPQQVNWEQVATYRVHLSAQTFVPCIPPCMNIQLEGMVR